MAQAFAEQIAAYEEVSVDQVVLGEILGLLGLYLGSQSGPGGEFLYSTPGYLALIDSAASVGSVGVGVPLNAEYRNDLPALRAHITPKTRALYLVHPHNPTGTVNDDRSFKSFLTEASHHAVAIVDEAYLEYTPDFRIRTAANLTRAGANVAVFRTFDKIQGLAGLPIGYVLAPKPLAAALRKQGAGDPESLGRLNLAAARAALADTGQVVSTRDAVARERARWLRTLDELQLPYTDTVANFMFFDAGRPQKALPKRCSLRGSTLDEPTHRTPNWARITIAFLKKMAARRPRFACFLRHHQPRRVTPADDRLRRVFERRRLLRPGFPRMGRVVLFRQRSGTYFTPSSSVSSVRGLTDSQGTLWHST